jgi:hypothetical protein
MYMIIASSLPPIWRVREKGSVPESVQTQWAAHEASRMLLRLQEEAIHGGVAFESPVRAQVAVAIPARALLCVAWCIAPASALSSTSSLAVTSGRRHAQRH